MPGESTSTTKHTHKYNRNTNYWFISTFACTQFKQMMKTEINKTRETVLNETNIPKTEKMNVEII